MKSVLKLSIAVFALSILFISCKKDPETVSGCTDPQGDNYNAEASVDNSSCTYQKRFLGDYSGDFKCKGLFAAVFTMADVQITELIKKDEVNIIISSTIGPLPVMGTLSKDTISVNATLPNLKVKAKDVFPAVTTEEEVLVDGKIVTKLGISSDNKILTGNLSLTLTIKETLFISGIPFPAGTSLNDSCDFVGTKK